LSECQSHSIISSFWPQNQISWENFNSLESKKNLFSQLATQSPSVNHLNQLHRLLSTWDPHITSAKPSFSDCWLTLFTKFWENGCGDLLVDLKKGNVLDFFSENKFFDLLRKTENQQTQIFRLKLGLASPFLAVRKQTVDEILQSKQFYFNDKQFLGFIQSSSFLPDFLTHQYYPFIVESISSNNAWIDHRLVKSQVADLNKLTVAKDGIVEHSLAYSIALLTLGHFHESAGAVLLQCYQFPLQLHTLTNSLILLKKFLQVHTKSKLLSTIYSQTPDSDVQNKDEDREDNSRIANKLSGKQLHQMTVQAVKVLDLDTSNERE